jgi:hypothetical protein
LENRLSLVGMKKVLGLGSCWVLWNPVCPKIALEIGTPVVVNKQPGALQENNSAAWGRLGRLRPASLRSKWQSGATPNLSYLIAEPCLIRLRTSLCM